VLSLFNPKEGESVLIEAGFVNQAMRKKTAAYSGFQMRATQLVRLRPRRQSLAGVSR
jgi:hypothetical protein